MIIMIITGIAVLIRERMWLGMTAIVMIMIAAMIMKNLSNKL